MIIKRARKAQISNANAAAERPMKIPLEESPSSRAPAAPLLDLEDEPESELDLDPDSELEPDPDPDLVVCLAPPSDLEPLPLCVLLAAWPVLDVLKPVPLWNPEVIRGTTGALEILKFPGAEDDITSGP